MAVGAVAHWTIYKIDFVGMKHTFINGHGSLCKIIASDEVIYPSLLETSTLPPQNSCPFPKGNYTIYDYIADEEKLPAALPLSEWQVELTLTLDAKICGGFRPYQKPIPTEGADGRTSETYPTAPLASRPRRS
uniref:MD-2-related lipid-recognition domain-containing protein n=1 Tax=Anopheles atroparvus TaxID=41427 RepID=A0A182IMF7_ANOAO